MITELEFKSLASQGYNRIPLMARPLPTWKPRCRCT
jgi:hypothetical protein